MEKLDVLVLYQKHLVGETTEDIGHKDITEDTEELEYPLDISKTVSWLIADLCEHFNVPGLPTFYGLSVVKLRKNKNDECSIKSFDRINPDCNIAKRIKSGAVLSLSLDAKIIERDDNSAVLRDVYKDLSLLAYSPIEKIAGIMVSLSKTGFTSPQYCQEFRKQNGHHQIVEIILASSGNSLAYALQAVEVYLETLGNYSFIKGKLLRKLFSSAIEQNSMNVCKRAIRMLSLLSDTNLEYNPEEEAIPNLGVLIFFRNNTYNLNWNGIFNLLRVPETAVQSATIKFINNFCDIHYATDDKWSFVPFLHKCGLLKELSIASETGDHSLWTELHRFQQFHFKWLIREMTVPFDVENEDHLTLLARLWKVSFPELPFGGPDHDEWKNIGFQCSQPQKDLRAMGILGLRHLIYYAETYPESYLEKMKEYVYTLENKEIEYQLPMCTMGINISAMIIRNILEIERTDIADGNKLHPMFLHYNGILNLYCIIFEYANCIWKRDNYNYMSFNTMMEKIIEYVRNALEQCEGRITPIQEFSELLLGEFEHKLYPLVVPDFDEELLTGDFEDINFDNIESLTVVESENPFSNLVNSGTLRASIATMTYNINIKDKVSDSTEDTTSIEEISEKTESSETTERQPVSSISSEPDKIDSNEPVPEKSDDMTNADGSSVETESSQEIEPRENVSTLQENEGKQKRKNFRRSLSINSFKSSSVKKTNSDDKLEGKSQNSNGKKFPRKKKKKGIKRLFSPKSTNNNKSDCDLRINTSYEKDKNYTISEDGKEINTTIEPSRNVQNLVSPKVTSTNGKKSSYASGTRSATNLVREPEFFHISVRKQARSENELLLFQKSRRNPKKKGHRFTLRGM
eukprot:TRINITY_DN12242_c0_g1_i1.p1 TRINITY_DN12242_c0_g1~~TRINITY_DN12242_c0_g1_i1.p1  ORF type:complete len:859 (-),score=178.59 TRINITY_DN12242_c0_g1_i1:47-2623(-)